MIVNYMEWAHVNFATSSDAQGIFFSVGGGVKVKIYHILQLTKLCKSFIYFDLNNSIDNRIDQRLATCGPWAACGP
jgi:hypothetical protein